MSIAFQEFFERLCQATDIASQMDLARALGVNRSAITQAKVRDAVPPKWILALARRYSLSPDWLEYGSGSPRPALGRAPGAPKPGAAPLPGRAGFLRPAPPVLPASHMHEGDIIYVPKAAARLCAGGGSFEVDAQPVAEYPLPRSWLSSLGSPANMVFMDVVGDSMEPGICDGDMVLVDRSVTGLQPSAILAVGVEDAIYLKRVEKRPAGLVLRSDNPRYSPMELYGDELDSFRLIGKMVWLSREYR